MGAPPRTHFLISRDAFAIYDKSLAEQGIQVIPSEKETREDLKTGTIASVNIHGSLKFDGIRCSYSVEQTPKGCILNIWNLNKDKDKQLALIHSVERAFPQPLPEATPYVSKKSNQASAILGTLACAGLIVFFLALCVFAFIGFRSLFP